MRRRDPIIAEVRAARDEIAKKYNYDIDAIFDAFQQIEAQSGREHVVLPPRRAVLPTKRKKSVGTRSAA